MNISIMENINWIKRLYRESVRNVPLLKYSWVLVSTVCILALIGYFKLRNEEVFLYALAVLVICFLGFVFSLFLNKKDKVIRFALYLFVYSLILTMCIAVLGLGSFIIFERPSFYRRWFPTENDSNDIILSDTIPKFDTSMLLREKKEFPSVKRPKINEPNNYQSRDTSVIEQTDIANVSDGSTRIAILPFEYISNENKYSWLSRGIPESILGAITRIEGYVVIESVQRDKILNEINFHQGKYVDVKSAVKIGKLLGAKKVIIGSCQVYGEQVEVTSRVVDIESGKIDSNSIVQHSSSNIDPFQLQKDFSIKIFNTLSQK